MRLRMILLMFRSFLILGSVCTVQQGIQAQCALNSFVPPDTLRFTNKLGDCMIRASEVLDSLGLENCNQVQLIPSGPYAVGDTRSVVVYDRDKDSIYTPFILVSTPMDITQLSGVSKNPSGKLFIEFPLGAGECTATKNMLLDQLNVDSSSIVRSQIQLIQGATRITDFPINDTVHLDAIICDGTVFYENIDVLFKPTAGTFSGIMNFEIGLTTCPVSIEDVLDRLGYDVNTCPISRFSISDSGPFNYGEKFIDFIRLDGYDVLVNSIIQVTSFTGCNISDMDFGALDQGKCALNEFDIIERLGLTTIGCPFENVRLEPPGPYESSPVRIQKIIIGGHMACTNSFDVEFLRDTTTSEQGALICHQDLNIAMGPDCQVRMNADVILAEGNYCYLNYFIELSYADDPANVIASGHEVVISSPGIYSLVISNPTTGNSCWAEFTVEDKFIEDIRCVPDTIWCYESLDLLPDYDTTGGGPDFPYLGPGIIYTPTGIQGEYNVSTATLCDVAFARYEDDVIDFCTNDFKEIIDRLWTFRDNFGNIDTCIQKLYVRNTTIDLIERFDRLEVNCLDDFAFFDANGHPSPESSGYPLIPGNRNADICGTLKMTYTDASFPLCGNGQKIIRRWVIIDWCSDQVMEQDQTIRIEDKEAPVLLEMLEDLSIDSDPFVCGATNIDLPLPNFTDCNLDEVDLEILYETYNEQGERIVKSNGSSLLINEILTNDIVSSFLVEYVLTDPCGNETRDSLTITISDNEPPVAVCDEYTVISVAGNGQASVIAKTFDDLSVDNCGIAKYEARKLDGDCHVYEYFSERIKFCCAEVGDTILVEFRVTDLAGNYNTCMVLVNIQDKFRPIITCPPDITLDCGVDHKNLEMTGRAEARDNCNPFELTYEDEEDIDQCYQGEIRRTWIVRDAGGFEETCVQIITIREDRPFDMDQAMFPADTTVIGCSASLEPEYVGSPKILTTSCAKVDATYNDLYFYDVENACVKILREWTVIDWCQRNASNSGIWKEDQIIRLISETGPLFQNEDLQRTFCIVNSSCSAEVSLIGKAIDGDFCTPAHELDWYFEIINESGVSLASGPGATINEQLGAGQYAIVFEAIDGCDNTTFDTLNIEVIDCAPPVISCPGVQPSMVLDQNGEAGMHVNDIVDVSVRDNCESSDDILLSFSKVDTVNEITITCADLVDGFFNQFVKLYAIDSRGNIDSCDLFVEVRDNSDKICSTDPGDSLSISGILMTEEFNEVENVVVTLMSPTSSSQMMTGADGTFKFSRLKLGLNYNLDFEKNTGHDDGVTTLDILTTQRHILAIKNFDTPYQTIAADTDNNGKVSVIDLVRMRRLVLGLDSTFTANGQQSWRFVKVDQVFENPQSPFPFEDHLEVMTLDHSLKNMDFMAVKIGDVNGTNSISSRFKSHSRNSSMPLIVRKDANRLHFISSTDVELSGLQLAFADFADHSVQRIEAANLNLGEDHYNLGKQSLKVSWTEDQFGTSIQKGDILFSIVLNESSSGDKFLNSFNAEQSEWINSALQSSRIIFQDYSSPKRTTNPAIHALQNFPNPFTDYSIVQFELNERSFLEIDLLDISGRRISNLSGWYAKGKNSITINSAQFRDTAGLYILKIKNELQSTTLKLSYVRQ